MIVMKIMAGLGNQMFQYATARAIQLDNNEEGYLVLDKLSNKTHNVYALDNFNISNDVKVVMHKRSFKNIINEITFRLYTLVLSKNHSKSKKNLQKLNNFTNKLGCGVAFEDYIDLKLKSKKKYLFGYFQAISYFDRHKDKIKEELKVIKPISKENEKLIKEMNEVDSICIHVRRGDYINSIHEVCTLDYYKQAINELNNELKNPKFYVFSDDIKWCKENLSFINNICFVEGNKNYDDLRLMYSCKHFIISNSTFSWWGQYLSTSKNKIVYAPKKWFNNGWANPDLYEDFWRMI